MTPLSEQIMDELMDRPQSMRQLADALGCSYERIRQIVYRLAADGLVVETSPQLTRGKFEMVWAMARTQRGKAA